MMARFHSLKGTRERRATEKLRRYWSSLAVDEEIPCVAGFKIRPCDPEWRERFLLKEDSDPRMPVFIFCGASVEPLLQASPLARPLLAVAPPHLRNELVQACKEVTLRRQAVDAGGSYWEQEEEIFYRYILLPVTSPTQEQGYIVGAYSTSLQSAAASTRSSVH